MFGSVEQQIRSLFSRVKILEDWASQVPTKVEDPRLSAVTSNREGGSTAGASSGGGGGGPSTIPESSVVFDPSGGHNHDGSDSTLIDLLGDATGTNAAVVVEKARGIEFPTPAAADDLKFLMYLHASTEYVLRGPTGPIVSTAIDLTATADHFVILVDASGANRTVTLPTAVGIKGRMYVVKKNDTGGNSVTVDADGAETIDGAATVATSVPYQSFTLISDNSGWAII